MSASAIVDGLVTMLSATSAFGTGGAGTDYSILNTTASCVVVGWSGFEFAPQMFGEPPYGETLWTISVEGFSKDTGDPVTLMKRNQAVVDTTLAVLKSDFTVQGTVGTQGGLWLSGANGPRVRSGTPGARILSGCQWKLMSGSGLMAKRQYVVAQAFLCPFEDNKSYGEGQVVTLTGWKPADIRAALTGPSPLLRVYHPEKPEEDLNVESSRP